ncbi:MAG: hypothetical protein HY831_00660 [Candidatus Aenigmarchaeota archaeon]|nr:hypothetical protein [Candidatus Aenigmarchaeota archaeon]
MVTDTISKELIIQYKIDAENAVKRPGVQHATFQIDYTTPEDVRVSTPVYLEFSTDAAFYSFVASVHRMRRKESSSYYIGAWHK